MAEPGYELELWAWAECEGLQPCWVARACCPWVVLGLVRASA